MSKNEWCKKGLTPATCPACKPTRDPSTTPEGAKIVKKTGINPYFLEEERNRDPCGHCPYFDF